MHAAEISLTDHTQWMRDQLEHQGFRVATPPDLGRILIEVIQEGQPLTPEIMHQHFTRHDHVVMFNPETPPDICELAEILDRPGITMVTTGHIHHAWQHAHVIEYENFFHEQQRLYQQPQCLRDLRALTHGDGATRRFDALLGQPKPHRDFIYQCIRTEGDQQFFCRYPQHHDIAQHRDFFWPKHCHSTASAGKQARYHGIAIDVAHVVPVEIYNDTCYSIVAETHTRSGYVFVTEKTAKCLLARRVFVMFAGAGYLAHLHRLGFRTFGDIIDEGYDQEPDDLRRWQRAWQQVQRLLVLDPEQVLHQVQCVLEHNHQLFVAHDWSYESSLAQHLRALLPHIS